ncbi:MAG: PadR family transcriptional regulator [Planctomycetota bacterium]
MTTTLTELEAVVLGVAHRAGPLTSYAVAREFAESFSSRWSGSAGAIYPAVKRLAARGFLAAEAGRRGRRAHRLFRLTPPGRKALRRWLLPLPESAGAAGEDPVRTRANFLALLSPTDRIAFVEEARARVRPQLERVEAEIARCEADGHAFTALALHGIRLELEGRLAWLALLRRRVPHLAERDASQPL